MIFLVFDEVNKNKSILNIDKGSIINPVPIKSNLFILQIELENIISQHDNTIIYTKREVLQTEFKEPKII